MSRQDCNGDVQPGSTKRKRPNHKAGIKLSIEGTTETYHSGKKMAPAIRNVASFFVPYLIVSQLVCIPAHTQQPTPGRYTLPYPRQSVHPTAAHGPRPTAHCPRPLHSPTCLRLPHTSSQATQYLQYVLPDPDPTYPSFTPHIPSYPNAPITSTPHTIGRDDCSPT